MQVEKQYHFRKAELEIIEKALTLYEAEASKFNQTYTDLFKEVDNDNWNAFTYMLNKIQSIKKMVQDELKEA